HSAGNGLCTEQIGAWRNEGASAANVPSIFRAGLKLTAPSNAAFIGEPATRSFTPLRLPESAAAKSASVRLAARGASRQMSRPVAPEVLDICGPDSGNSTPYKVSLNCRASSRMVTVPPSMRISENAATRCAVAWLRVKASIKPDQLD